MIVKITYFFIFVTEQLILMYKVSVLIPAYNSGPFIGRCLRSALSQTLDGIEYIIIDDASTDDTQARIEEAVAGYPWRRNDVRIIRHETNMGPCAARKTGLDAASGDFIIHLDSDDWVEPECYGRMYRKAIETGADVVCCGYVEERDSGPHPGLFGAAVPEDKEKLIRDVIALKVYPFPFKLVRRTVFEDSRFRHPVADMAEDWALSVQYALIARRWSYVDEILCHYSIRETSVSHDIRQRDRAIRVMRMEKINVENVIRQLEDMSLAGRYAKEIEARKSNVKRFMLPFLSDSDARAIWKQTFPEIDRSMLTNSLIPAEYRIKHLCALFGIYTQLYAAFKIITGRQ